MKDVGFNAKKLLLDNYETFISNKLPINSINSDK